ncbi:FecR family protein [Terrimonas sp. NA20]|uniref:FecR family protein n=1 Tax=Terrimonas ginsenosidimutans TaxID=2908004 RepID=A0ABS9KSD2_9BACT|nr:FecR family protein [Terrimonas ginsenosidimutans]MCG2615244.1 FecR family protein [Terrimonas ginsenosidimutans]
MSSNPLRLQLLFKKYINNECSREELQEFWQLTSELSDNDLLSDEIKRYWDSDTPDKWNETRMNSGKTYEEIMQRAALIETGPKILPLYRRKWPRYVAAAASVLLVFALFFLFRQEKQEKQLANANKIETGTHPHQVISLPDGTKVTLNGNSRLEYPPVFNGEFREVNLVGEAFFEVTHDPEKPFLVHTGSIVTRVLGTSFNIKAVPGEKDVAVTVVSGKVQVMENKKVLGLLTKNDQIMVNTESHKVSQSKVEVKDIMQWKAEDLVFEDITWERAAIMIANRYGVSIRFENEAMRNCRFSGTFLSDNGLEQVLDVVCTLTSATWQKDAGGVAIKGAGCR